MHQGPRSATEKQHVSRVPPSLPFREVWELKISLLARRHMRVSYLCLLALSGASGFAAPRAPPQLRRVSRGRPLPRIVAAEDAEPRPPYVLTGLPRPLWRGRMMGWAHSTKAWYLLSLAYVVAAWRMPTRTPIGAGGLALRIAAAAASSANIRISDGYHNADRRGEAALTPETELFWLRWDYVGISSVLTTLLWLWAFNFGFVGRLRAVCVAGGVATGLVGVISRTVVPRKIGHTLVKVIMALQFVGLLGYLCVKCVTTCPARCSTFFHSSALSPQAIPSPGRHLRLSTRLAHAAAVVSRHAYSSARALPAVTNALIFWVYAPGLILYVLKRPQDAVFGFHELFHTSVLAGHLSSMALDLRDIALPCSRGLCGL